ncbi:FAD-binding oxidoreductase [Roseateles cellulosilyticus]|uniref:FAD-binding oxidoreductase n=1 Tax=Pelomonas cellulosilytica TaxID=2906762 RepID=A0ABS8XY99_9BURK|nr:FAD-binding oxidoreductase [Pelomonas sp. P8]MCE4554310.1 FAD-binding oxidoreductase [Pelomonas sp. P8]
MSTSYESPPPTSRQILNEPLIADDGTESLTVWGFDDSRFELLPDRSVVMQGGRYALSQQKMTSLVPWIEGLMDIELRADDRRESLPSVPVPASRATSGQLAALRQVVGSSWVVTDDRTRQRHGHGHTQDEMAAIKYGGGMDRVPDVVVCPDAEDQILALIELAREQCWVLVPYGGGTNVSEALRCPPEETRCIVSVDMRRMNRLIWLDPVNRMACIEAGAVGRHIVRHLAKHGFTMGHEPDSIEFSTLGGWIATHASGMKKNRYGNIEDVVLDVHLATRHGLVSRRHASPRESCGMDPRLLAFGSEGNVGIVTRAVVRLHPLPPVQRYDSYVFKDFESGVAFMRAASDRGSVPASLRLVDNAQFQFGQALKGAPASGLARLKSRLEKWFVLSVLGYDADRMVACTVVHEGEAGEVSGQAHALRQLARRHGGMRGGAENGQRGYQLTFAIAYIRDFIMRHHMIAESFETSVAWSQAPQLCEQVKARVRRAHAARGLPGLPFVSCRVTQVYPTGVCIYFYLAIYAKGVEDAHALYAELEHEAREEILACGGSLSHHHGIGKLRAGFLGVTLSRAEVALRQQLFDSLDPQAIFGLRNQGRRAPGPLPSPSSTVQPAAEPSIAHVR